MATLPGDAAGVAALRERVFADRFAPGLLVARDARAAGIWVRFKPMSDDEFIATDLEGRLRATLASIPGPEELAVTGLPTIKVQAARDMVARPRRCSSRSPSLLVTGMVIWAFRTWRGVLLPLATMVIGLRVHDRHHGRRRRRLHPRHAGAAAAADGVRRRLRDPHRHPLLHRAAPARRPRVADGRPRPRAPAGRDGGADDDDRLRHLRHQPDSVDPRLRPLRRPRHRGDLPRLRRRHPGGADPAPAAALRARAPRRGRLVLALRRRLRRAVAAPSPVLPRRLRGAAGDRRLGHHAHPGRDRLSALLPRRPSGVARQPPHRQRPGRHPGIDGGGRRPGHARQRARGDARSAALRRAAGGRRPHPLAGRPPREHAPRRRAGARRPAVHRPGRSGSAPPAAGASATSGTRSTPDQSRASITVYTRLSGSQATGALVERNSRRAPRRASPPTRTRMPPARWCCSIAPPMPSSRSQVWGDAR